MSNARLALMAFGAGVSLDAALAMAVRLGWNVPYIILWGHNPLGWWIADPVAEWMVSIGLYWSVNTWSLWFDVVVAVTFGAQLSLLATGARSLSRAWRKRQRAADESR
jgi:hypothetical protein